MLKDKKYIKDMFMMNSNEMKKAVFYDTLLDADTSAVLEDNENFYGKLFYRYQPTNYSFLEYIFDKYPFEKEDHIMDVGFGKGRVLLMASYFGCNRISGCEVNEEYFRDASLNIERYVQKTMSKTVFTLFLEDARKIKVDDTVNKYFFFNPFHLKVYIKFFENLMVSLRQRSRDIIIFLYSPLPSTLKYLERLSDFHLVDKMDINEEHTLFAIYQSYKSGGIL